MHELNINTKTAAVDKKDGNEPSQRARTEMAGPAASPLEREYGAFFDATITNAGDSASFMQELNRVHQIVSGLGVVMRIVTGNGALQDTHEPGTDSAPPLSRAAQGMLTAMAAAVCEQLRDHVQSHADRYNDKVPA